MLIDHLKESLGEREPYYCGDSPVFLFSERGRKGIIKVSENKLHPGCPCNFM